jgi:acetyl-CoA synthetase
MELDRGVFSAPAEFVERAHVNAAAYEALYAASLSDPDAFWGAQGRRIDWIRDYGKVKNTSFQKGAVSIRWFEDGTLNVSANCIDRHMISRANQTAIIWHRRSC